MDIDYNIVPLTQDRFNEAVSLVLKADLDTQEEIEHHLQHLDAHYIAIADNKVVGVVGWYQDNVHFADKAMGSRFPGEDVYWVGFFAVTTEHQGKGIGSALMEKLEEVVKDKQTTTLWVVSVPETRTYYESKGFKLVMEGKINDKQKFFLCKHLT